ncbi:MAG: hypothetical protein KUG77_16765 [Nannocystaceae bacterium]|nr:hypothetical protein [Nannocystaceae bacterium]
MTKALSIHIAEEQLDALREKAKRLGVAVEDLARAGVLDLIRRPDGTFERVAERLLKKNAELYRRLG